METLKRFLIFREMKVSSSDIRKFLYFLKRKLFLYFRKPKHWKIIPYTLANGAYLCFRKRKPEKIICISAAKLSCIWRSNFPSLKNKKSHSEKLLIYPEMEFSSPKTLNKTPLRETGCLSSHWPPSASQPTLA